MAITNAQQYKQLVNPPMKGNKRPGYRGDDAARSDAASGRDAGRADPGGGVDDRGSREQNINQRNVVREARVRAVEDFIDRPTFGFTDAAKFNIAPLPIKFIQGIGNLFTGTTKPVDFSGMDRDGDIPYWAQLGYSSESEYLAALARTQAPSTMDQGTTAEDDKDDRFIRFRAEGGPIGGEYDFESARQMYGLGKLVKKVTRTVKKIAKSPIGKAALIGAAGFGIPGTSFGGLFGRAAIGGKATGLFGTQGIGQAFTKFMGGKLSPNLFDEVALTGKQNIFQKAIGAIPGGVTGAIIGASALAGFLTPAQEEEAQKLAEDEGIDIEAARNSILARARDDYKMDFRARGFRAEGGIMRAGYQEGSKEPVAKKTMPLLDMGGKEMDLRENGGFVPIGRMEKADDVPARLSKNEFVFTADAVRNAGDGDVDKGAEVMYNMMKNLEAGGDVSKESQGLEGARRMFQTSQRLEEVL